MALAGPRHYVYYRVAAADLAAATEAARAMQAALRRSHPHVAAELLRRPPEPGRADRDATLMEVYATAYQNGIGDALAAEIECLAEAALARWLAGPRHVERFEPV